MLDHRGYPVQQSANTTPYGLWLWVWGVAVWFVWLGLWCLIFWQMGAQSVDLGFVLRKAFSQGVALFYLTIFVALAYGLYLRPYRWFWWAVTVLHLCAVMFAWAEFALPARISPVLFPIQIELVILLACPILCLGLLWQMHRRTGPYQSQFSLIGGVTLLVICLGLGIWNWTMFGPYLEFLDVPLARQGDGPFSQLAVNPLATPAHIVPEWYFLPTYAALRIPWTKELGLVALWVLSVAPILLPFLCRGTAQPFWRMRGQRWIVPAIVLLTVALGAFGAAYPSTANRAIAGAVLCLLIILLLGAIPRATRRRA
jgi:quinol-cytochrome oxidoreductase complex cytochrome b subunit